MAAVTLHAARLVGAPHGHRGLVTASSRRGTQKTNCAWSCALGWLSPWLLRNFDRARASRTLHAEHYQYHSVHCHTPYFHSATAAAWATSTHTLLTSPLQHGRVSAPSSHSHRSPTAHRTLCHHLVATHSCSHSTRPLHTTVAEMAQVTCSFTCAQCRRANEQVTKASACHFCRLWPPRTLGPSIERTDARSAGRLGG